MTEVSGSDWRMVGLWAASCFIVSCFIVVSGTITIEESSFTWANTLKEVRNNKRNNVKNLITVLVYPTKINLSCLKIIYKSKVNFRLSQI